MRRSLPLHGSGHLVRSPVSVEVTQRPSSGYPRSSAVVRGRLHAPVPSFSCCYPYELSSFGAPAAVLAVWYLPPPADPCLLHVTSNPLGVPASPLCSNLSS